MAEDGRRDVLAEIEIGGSDGRPAKDGVNALANGMRNNSNVLVEMTGSQTPTTVARHRLPADSAGPGRHRGGPGLVRERRAGSPECLFTANMDRFVHAPYGLAGGMPAAAGRLVLARDGRESGLPPKADNAPLRKGDRVRLETSGGGGLGDPKARAAEAVERDPASGYVTRGR